VKKTPTESDNLFNTRKWNKNEVERLEEAYWRHGNDWMAVSTYGGTRSNEQCRSKVKETPTIKSIRSLTA
jgi:hypothetical protein